MRPLISLLLLMLLALAGCASGAAATPTAPPSGGAPSGRWVVSDFQPGPISALSQDEARAYLGQVAEFGDATITFDGQTCDLPNAAREPVDTADYFLTLYKADVASLGITQPSAERISAPCDLPGFGEFIALDDGRLVINRDGIFFFLTQE